jgi:hypothetical protein
MLTFEENIKLKNPILSYPAQDSVFNNVYLQKIYNSILLKLVLPITAFSVSWFITDDYGNIQKNGVAQIENLEIDISTLPKGNYYIRVLGEVHNFELT